MYAPWGSEGVVRCTYQRRSKNLLKVQPHGIGGLFVNPKITCYIGICVYENLSIVFSVESTVVITSDISTKGNNISKLNTNSIMGTSDVPYVVSDETFPNSCPSSLLTPDMTHSSQCG